MNINTAKHINLTQMKNYLFFIVLLIALASCQKSELARPAKNSTSINSNTEEQTPTYENLITKDDKTLYIDPEYEITGNEKFGPNCYNFVIGIKEIDGKWVKVHFCSGKGNKGGLVYAGEGQGHDVIGVYKTND